jgi:hypothetical protein
VIITRRKLAKAVSRSSDKIIKHEGGSSTVVAVARLLKRKSAVAEAQQ